MENDLQNAIIVVRNALSKIEQSKSIADKYIEEQKLHAETTLKEWEAKQAKVISEVTKAEAKVKTLNTQIATLAPERDTLLAQVTGLKQAIASVTAIKL